MTDKLTEALRVGAVWQTWTTEEWQAVMKAARRWRDFPTDDDVRRIAGVIYGPGYIDAVALGKVRIGLEAVKREDR